jgi:hypothetical protein
MGTTRVSTVRYSINRPRFCGHPPDTPDSPASQKIHRPFLSLSILGCAMLVCRGGGGGVGGGVATGVARARTLKFLWGPGIDSKE